MLKVGAPCLLPFYLFFIVYLLLNLNKKIILVPKKWNNPDLLNMSLIVVQWMLFFFDAGKCDKQHLYNILFFHKLLYIFLQITASSKEKTPPQNTHSVIEMD